MPNHTHTHGEREVGLIKGGGGVANIKRKRGTNFFLAIGSRMIELIV